ncbi:MAG: DUF5606 domain-containing protein [Flavobacteriales bacterium]|nr:DUF5606 domain-containing protein [Flavobacteriales bacterium]
MDLSKIIAISGKPGLFKVIAKSKNGVVVESIVDNQRFTAHSSFIISSFEDISIYSNNDDYPLKDVLKKISESSKGEKCIGHKSSEAELKKFMIDLLPDYDEDRVYVSDIKKLVKWYNILQEAKILEELIADAEEPTVEDASYDEADGTKATEGEKEEKPKKAKKAAAKKPTAKKETVKKSVSVKAPAKKAAGRGK